MRLGDLLVVLYEIERVAFRVVLAAVVVKFVSEAWAAWRVRPRGVVAAPVEWPRVTVQLPIRNEYYVAERVIRAAAELAYPADRLELQVLDDSDDATLGVIDRVAAQLSARGVDIHVLRRGTAEGAKAGALAYGVARAKGEYVAVFDADFVPPPDFLARTIPELVRDPTVGMVQGRWAFANRRASVLTRTQALVIDGLMLVEQPARCARGQPIHFNGAAGVWRRACVDDAGGWSATSITEDLEISVRAVRRGWRLVQLADVVVQTDLPATMSAYRSQQLRWTRGNAQVLRAAGWQLLRSSLPLRRRIGLLARICARSLYVLLSILTVAMPLTTFNLIPWIVDYDVAVDAGILAVVVAASCIYYLPAHARGAGTAAPGIMLVPPLLALHIGLSVACGVAFVAGIVRRTAEFVRTPKLGAGGDGPRYAMPLDLFALVELAIGAAYLVFAGLAIARELPAHAVLFVLWATAFSWIGGATVLEHRRSSHREPHGRSAAPASAWVHARREDHAPVPAESGRRSGDRGRSRGAARRRR